jgi:hypothetical protein
MRALE